MKKIIRYLKDNPPVLFYGLAIALLFFAALISAACMTPVMSVAGQSTSAPKEAVSVEPTESLSAPTATQQAGEVWVVCKNANVRPNPSADDRVLDWKLKGDRVIVLEWVNGWARIGDAMYINGWLLCPVEEGHAR